MDAPKDVVGRVTEVLRILGRHEPEGATTSAVARGAGLARATAHRLLSSLRERGYAERDEQTDRWVLGPELHLLGVVASRRYDVSEVARPVVRELAEITGESAFFSIRRGDETVCLVREEGAFPIRSHVLFEGARFPLGVVSAGMVILAHLPPDEAEVYLGRVDLVAEHGSAHSGVEVRKHLLRTRRAGYAVNPGLVVEGSWGVAAAVFDAAGSPRWALSLTGVEHRFAQPRRAQLGELLLRKAHELGPELAPRV